MAKIKGLPYQGSKQSIAKSIVDTILQIKPLTTKVYDLFGGGGSIAYEFASRGIEVICNDIDTSIIALHKALQDGTYKPTTWMDREEFHINKKGDTWENGFAKCAYSFGGDGTSYLYSKYREKIAKSIMSNDIKFLNEELSLYLEQGMTVKEILQHIKYYDIGDLTPHTQLQHMQNINRMNAISDYTFLNNITFLNKNMMDIEIEGSKHTTLVYLDPPYKETKGYSVKADFDILEYKQVNKYPMFLSELESDIEGFKAVLALDKREIKGTNNTKIVKERLYYAR